MERTNKRFNTGIPNKPNDKSRESNRTRVSKEEKIVRKAGVTVKERGHMIQPHKPMACY